MRAAKKLIAAEIVPPKSIPASPPTCRRSSWRWPRKRDGVSRVRETIFENRFMHASEMMRMGANIVIDGNRGDRHRADAAVAAHP